MQRVLFAAVAGLLCTASALSAAAAPPNDACGAAIDVSAGGTYNGTLVDATADGGATCGSSVGNPDVWYTFTAPGNLFGTLNLNAQGSNAANGVDTVFAVFTACGGAELACNDDFDSFPDSNIDVNLAPGQSVTIRVSKFGGSIIVAPFDLNVTFTPTAPSNDNCANAIDISAGGTTVGTFGASTPDGLGTCGGTEGAKDVWYRYTNTSGCQGSVDLNMCGTADIFSVDPVLSVFDSCGGNVLDCNDDAGDDACGFGLDSRIVYGLNPGQTIWIRVAPFDDAYDGRFQITATFTALSNDACGSPIRIFDGATNFCTDGATTDGPTEGACAGSNDPQINQDVWYTYVATRTGLTTINTCANTTFDSKIGIYLGGCPGGPNTVITCNDDACGDTGRQSSVSFNATAGQAYTLRVGGYLANFGTGTITITPPAPCRADFNDDGFLDFFDFDDFVNCFETEICPPGKTADYNNDDFVDFFDFDDFVTDFSNGC
jgi:hypothetical protein